MAQSESILQSFRAAQIFVRVYGTRRNSALDPDRMPWKKLSPVSDVWRRWLTDQSYALSQIIGETNH
jgi:hypothetical protein